MKRTLTVCVNGLGALFGNLFKIIITSIVSGIFGGFTLLGGLMVICYTQDILEYGVEDYIWVTNTAVIEAYLNLAGWAFVISLVIFTIRAIYRHFTTEA